MKVLFGKHEGRYKANLHCHTRASDGRAAAETVKEEYMKRGYSVVAFTDHEHLINVQHLTDENFVAINGCELSVGGPKVDLDSPKPSSKQTHMNFYAKDPACDYTPCYNEKHDWYKFDDLRHLVKHDDEPYPRVHTPEAINEMVRVGHEKGFLVSYNHPEWSLHTACDYLNFDGFDFIEVYNSGSVTSGYTESDSPYNAMMKAGKNIKCVAADDNHNIFGFEGQRSDAFGGWVVFDAPSLDYKTIIGAMESGDFYASTGPEIHSIYIDDAGLLHVECSPVMCGFKIPQGRPHAMDFAPEGETTTHLTFKFRVCDVRFRVKIMDRNGKCAWSQIYEIPEGTYRVDAEPPKA